MAKQGKYVYDYPRPMVTVDAIVFAKQQNKWHVLLIRRNSEPFKGLWAIPGGFVEMDEELEDAVVRELAEETHLTNVRLEQMHTFGTVGRDPRGRQITIAFMGIATENLQTVKGGDDAADARWFDLDHLPEKLAFDHNDVLAMATKKLEKY